VPSYTVIDHYMYESNQINQFQ